ncbi:SusC/RagA family TonB-linked outer membrane protein [Sphingobacterium paucimobilis]|uniref:Secretin/TonB short N-terminal domain-containing protein n=1 Tax=Sphingobacterium paucimobilis HER1398 TaxID=1346330 RepID=U2JBU6_9SPHI|nr:SusC/RagA family TonB-linked outer membrane protein [Sphingobacterium paucimobilis]ERJ60118.1 hypothetical protein M472_15240 [Sphingobacterium paucimobilis HER1398]
MKISLNPFLQNGKGGVSLIEPSQTNPRAVFDNTKTPFFLARPLTRTLMKLNLIALLLGLGLSQVDARTYAQQVTLKRQKTNLETILKDFEKQSGYTFFYKKTDIAPIKGVDIDVKNMPLDQALNSVLKNGNFTYEYFDKTIVIKKEPLSSNREIPINSLSRTTELVTSKFQQDYVIGKVLDEHKKPVAGATVTLKSNPKSVVATNQAGDFYLPMSSNNQEVIVSLLGYKQHVQRVTFGKPNLIVLKVEEGELEEVVVSTGIFQKVDKSFTGSSRTVTREELKAFGNRNLITSLRNIDPSFNIIESNSFGSDPNRMPEIQIRGNSSIPNVNEIQSDAGVSLNTPLIILDGFESSLRKLLDINENDVESLTILKDASATAMYGSRGANGVVVITTRTPRVGRLRVSFGTNINIENPDLSDYSLINGRDKLELERIAGYYDNARAETDFPLKQYYNFLLSEINRGVETDWKSIPLRTSFGQRNDLRIEGGDSKFRYSASFQNNNVKGVMKGSGRNNFNGDITLAYILEKVRFRNNLQVQYGRSDQSPYGGFEDYTKLNSYWTPYDANGNVVKSLGDPGSSIYSSYWTTLPANPMFNASLNTYDYTNLSELVNNTSVEWNILSELQLRGRIGLTKSNTQDNRFRPAEHTAFKDYPVDDLFRKGDYRFGNSNHFKYDAAINISYNNIFSGKHQVFGGIDANIKQVEDLFSQYEVEGFPNENLDYPSMALQYSQGSKPYGKESLTRAVGFVANGNYAYDDRYATDLTVRFDGASQFGNNKRFAAFWSAGLAWNIHNEAFLKENPYVNRLKVRASIGTSGSQNFNAYQAMTTYKYYSDDRYFNWLGAYALGLGNEDLKWQSTLKNNIGLDAEFFDNRLKLTADYYIQTTEDLVSSVNLPASNGFDSYTANIGRLRNKGYEVAVTGILLKNPEGLTWSVSTGFYGNRNKMLETSQALKDAQKVIQTGTIEPGTMYVEGYSSRAIWVVPSLGIDPSTGKEMYLTANGEPTYTWNSSDVTAVGTTEPKIYGNFSTMVRYKNLTLNASFRYNYGSQSYNKTLRDKVELTNYKYNVDSRVFDSRWQYPGDFAAFKGILVTTPTYKTSRFVQDENTLIVSNINLQYQMSRMEWIKRLGMESLYVTADVGEPFHFSTIRQERGTSYPFSRMYSLKLNVTF